MSEIIELAACGVVGLVAFIAGCAARESSLAAARWKAERDRAIEALSESQETERGLLVVRDAYAKRATKTEKKIKTMQARLKTAARKEKKS